MSWLMKNKDAKANNKVMKFNSKTTTQNYYINVFERSKYSFLRQIRFFKLFFVPDLSFWKMFIISLKIIPFYKMLQELRVTFACSI